jgi:hypothetical protein
MNRHEEYYDVVVCGGGLAGLSAAVAAAREGSKTCLIQDRPVLGGNSSSEIRVTPHGAAACHAYARETGIISEVLIEERARNHEEPMENGGMNSVWDMILYDMALTTPNLTLHLNTMITGLLMAEPVESRARSAVDQERTTLNRDPNIRLGFYHRPPCNISDRINAVCCRVSHAEIELTVHGQIFVDATGDGIVADLAGCEWRMGAESKEEFGESHGLVEASTEVMGSSIHFRTKDMGSPCAFRAPAWAVSHKDPKYFECHKRSLQDPRGGYWWFEISAPWHTIHDNETIRHELTRHVLGVWDWMKNQDPVLKERLANYALDWIGQVPGKRESRRIMGRYLLTENDVVGKKSFDDEIAFGGWYVDLHKPGGLLLDGRDEAKSDGEGPPTYCGPYGIPLRMLIAKDIDNLLLAGRNISATHVALGTVRVMGTTALTGQAAGVAAAVAIAKKHCLEQAAAIDIWEIQQKLLRGGCFLLSARNEDPHDLALTARVKASSERSFSQADPDLSHKEGTISTDRLSNRRAQWLTVSESGLNSLSLYLTNTSDSSEKLEVQLVDADHIWDYRLHESELTLLAKASLEVPGNFQGWLKWECPVAVQTRGYLRLDVFPNRALIWHSALKTVTGFPGAFEFAPGQMRNWPNPTTSAFRIDPVQRPWSAAEVVTGVARPYQQTNHWCSDDLHDKPEWIELRWENAVTLSSCELTFPGNLLLEHHKYPPFWRDPQTPANYEIQTWHQEAWKTQIQVEGNYQSRRVHQFDTTVKTDRLRVVITKTNGDPSAAITEIRCYV